MSENSHDIENYSFSDLIEKIIKCAKEVHTHLGYGFQEDIYKLALAVEFELRSIPFERELEMPLYYKGEQIGTRRIDFFVDERVMVELTASSKLEDIHIAQGINYLEAYNMKVGLLINFGGKSLIFKRVTNEKYQRLY